MQISISVRNIIELVLRSGDIDSGYLSARRAQDGIRIHKRIQQRRKREAKLGGFSYDSEVSLGVDFEYQGFVFRVEGRADGVITGDGVSVIEEIKSTLRPAIDAPNALHLAQAKMYGYMYCAANAVDEVGVCLTYCNVETEEITEFNERFGKRELYEFFGDIVERYYEFAQMDAVRIAARVQTAKALEFPYAGYRAGQRELATAVYRTIKAGRELFAQAPTGTGKTISVLFPAVKALGEGKIFYLTAKTVTRRVANAALERMSEHGLCMRSVTLTAKEKLCPTEDMRCNPLDCEYAAGHFDRVNAAIMDVIKHETVIRREQLERYAQKHRVCPFELSLDVAGFCDCIVCDYNHVYDPKVQLKRFFGDNRNNEMIILTDEAHNLVERARDMFSAQLTRSDFALRGMFRKDNIRIYRLLGRIKGWFDQAEGLTLAYALPDNLIHMLREFVTNADVWLSENPAHPRHAEFLELYFRVLDFLRTSEFFDKRYVMILDDRRKDTSVKLLCLDPSFLLAQTHKRTRAAVFFSATLTPLKYFRDVFGGEQTDFGIRLPSPFSQANLCLMVSEVQTTYKHRENSIRPVADRIHAFVTAKPAGNYLVFFSSYDYMNSVYACFASEFPDTEVMLQSVGMDEQARELFLARFSDTPKAVLVGFAVMGGVFSEGIDLAGERLSGAVVVGVGLPLISAERNILADYYKNDRGMGFEYAYMYPGMNKVMQAAGRVIRTEHDRGAVLLIDSRFTDYGYRQLFPEEWSHFIRANTAERIRDTLEGFWNAHDTADGSL